MNFHKYKSTEVLFLGFNIGEFHLYMLMHLNSVDIYMFFSIIFIMIAIVNNMV